MLLLGFLLTGWFRSLLAADPDSAGMETVSKPAWTDPKHALFDAEATYLWPTNASPYASSSFAETRAAHFHAALDIKTWGRKGYKVFATRDGVLARVGVYAVGYGNVVYLKHSDSTYSVYAHLEQFAPKIRHFVDSLRLIDYSFEIDHVFNHRTIRFEQGEVLGYSGATGVGPPHLHFELRTENHKPFNPLLTNLAIPDNRAPRFDGLAVEPLSPTALVEGKKQIYTRPPRYNQGSYHFGEIDVQGTIGLGIDVFDLANRVSNAYAVYELKLKYGNKVLFHSRVDSFSYQNTRQLYLDRVFPILQATRQGYQRLYIADGNKLPFYQRNLNPSGKLNLPPGKHSLTILASDFYGNQRKATVTLDVHPARLDTLHTTSFASLNPTPHNGRSYNASTLDDWFWQDNSVAINTAFDPFSFLPESQGNVLSPSMGNPILLGPYQIVPLYESTVISQAGTDRKLRLSRVYPGDTTHIYSDDRRISVLFSPQSLYDTLSVALLTNQSASDSSLTTMHIYPKNKPVRKDYHIQYSPDSLPQNISADKWGFYWWHPRKHKYVYIKTRLNNNNALAAQPAQFGQFSILADTSKPRIWNPRLYRHSDGHWRVSVKVKDHLSGVDFHHARMYVNGKRGIPEYDPEHDRLIYFHPEFQPEKDNQLKVRVPDYTGNVRQKIFHNL